jgi:hypothetical protein
MTEKFNVKAQAQSLAKLMEMADFSITKPGGAIATERLIDYATSEFARLSMAQCLEVLAVIDKDFAKKLLKDGSGAIIGYVYSKKIFVSMRRDLSPNESEFSKKFKGRRS